MQVYKSEDDLMKDLQEYKDYIVSGDVNQVRVDCGRLLALSVCTVHSHRLANFPLLLSIGSCPVGHP
jgi:DNA mismatch repair protein MutH